MENKEETVELIKTIKKKKAPTFLNQIPHLVLQPNDEAIIDVEVDSSTNVRLDI